MSIKTGIVFLLLGAGIDLQVFTVLKWTIRADFSDMIGYRPSLIG